MVHSVIIEYINNSLMIFIFSYICHHRGHLARECDEKSHQPIQCFRCQAFGHIARNCTAVTHNFRRKDAKNSAEGYQSSSRSTKTKSRPLNSSYAAAAPQRKFRRAYLSHTLQVNKSFIGVPQTTAVLSTQGVQICKEVLTKRKVC